MMYQGGKGRLAKDISDMIAWTAGGRSTYIEPFLGSAAVFAAAAPYFERSFGSDLQEDLILLWQAALEGWRAPEYLSLEQYETLKNDPVPSPMRAFAAYPCSFAGKRFGGYAVDPDSQRNYARAGSRSIEQRVKKLRKLDITLKVADYRVWDDMVNSDTVVYCDPPYADTVEYRGADGFDHAEFWDVMTRWSDRGALILVSEYTAPPGWTCKWEIERHTSTAIDNEGARATDRLFASPSVKVESGRLF